MTAPTPATPSPMKRLLTDPIPVLLPCPFCGSEPYHCRTVNGTRMHKVGCSPCGIEIKAAEVCYPDSTMDHLTKDIYAIWNRRTSPPNQNEQLPAVTDAAEFWDHRDVNGDIRELESRMAAAGARRERDAAVARAEVAESNLYAVLDVLITQLNRLPNYPCRVDEMTDREIAISKVASHMIDAAYFAIRKPNSGQSILAALDATEKTPD